MRKPASSLPGTRSATSPPAQPDPRTELRRRILAAAAGRLANPFEQRELREAYARARGRLDGAVPAAPISEAQLVDAVVAEAQVLAVVRALYRYQPLVRRILRKRLSPSDRELHDVEAQVFARAWRALAAGEIPRKPGSFLATVANNLASDQLRRRCTERRAKFALGQVVIAGEEGLFDEALRLELARLMADEELGPALVELGGDLSERAVARALGGGRARGARVMRRLQSETARRELPVSGHDRKPPRAA